MPWPIRRAQSLKLKGEGFIKSKGRVYRRDYVVFLRAAEGKIAFLREYFDPVRAAKALDTPLSASNPADKRLDVFTDPPKHPSTRTDQPATVGV
jgi:hypothetical protein